MISMDPCKGLYPIPPYYLPFKVTVLPYEVKTIGFIIEPEGFQYNMREKYYIRRVQWLFMYVNFVIIISNKE